MDIDMDNMSIGPKMRGSEESRFNFSSPRRIGMKLTAKKYTETMKKNVVFYENEEFEDYE
jgi:hypothetical protein